ncbi:aromatic hydrocarbon degradation protein [Novimethylophilus kurashikiensis]|uniref:Aromatic hydrocarbon degradation protein n=1 Tax=Novimethylophilus kurashikiensis TaxID=1825523 RepID=A0A2R5F2N8_9PROT|nr:hypothetical protein [Novimethylophilus kurashikiensis]GBG12847.1 aromatic hydrocarbon degradation protein [Novimethylophilus kurashikiensis]
MTKIKIKKLAMSAMLLLGASTAFADDDTPSMLDVHGFGTLGAVYHDEHGVQFRRDVSQGHGAGAGHLSFAPDSMLGLQVTAHFRPDVEATIQAISHLNVDNNYKPDLTWAFLKYSPSDDWYIRAGRLALDFYVQGDSAEIGYSNLLIRQPIVTIPRSYDGIDIDWRRPVEGGLIKVRGMAGLTSGNSIGADGANRFDYRDSEVLASTLEYSRGSWMGRYTFGRLKIDKEFKSAAFKQLLSALQFAPNGASIIDRLSFKDRVLNYQQIALAYDQGPVQALISYDNLTSDNWPGRQEFIATAGYRLGDITPYAGFFKQHSDRKIIHTGIPDGLSVATDALNMASALSQSGPLTNQTDFILGARYDFTPHKALKFQADRIRYQDPGTAIEPGLFQQTYEQRGHRAFTVISVALDFVF